MSDSSVVNYLDVSWYETQDLHTDCISFQFLPFPLYLYISLLQMMIKMCELPTGIQFFNANVKCYIAGLYMI